MKSSQEIRALLFKPQNKNWGFYILHLQVLCMFPAVCKFQSVLIPGKKSPLTIMLCPSQDKTTE